MRKRLLVTGASGFLGWNLIRIATDRYEIYGIFLHNPCPITTITSLRYDLTDPLAVDALFRAIKPEAVIHTAAAANTTYCQNHSNEAALININASVAIAQQCARHNIPCVFTSTDLVFNGTTPPYKEDDPVCPLNIYGAQKVAAERSMATAYPDTIICRMPLLYGDAPPHAQSFIQPIIASLLKGEVFTLFTDEYRTPLSAVDAGKGLLLALESAAPGETLHLAGPERLSRFTIGRLLAEQLGVSASVIKPCRQKDMAVTAPRAADVSLDGSKARAYSFCPGTMQEELKKLACVHQLPI